MFQKVFKLVPITVGSLVSTTTLLTAADFETRVSSLETQVDAISQKSVHDNWGAKYPSTHPKEFRHGLIVSGDLLYWRADEDGLEYVIKAKNISTNNNWTNASLEDLHFDWHFGYRAGIGYDLPWDGWDFYVNYTHYQNGVSDSKSRGPHSQLGAVWIPSGLSLGPVDKAKAHWNLEYNTLDLEIGRNYFLSRALSFRPFFGVRGAWIDQSMRYSYDYLNITPPDHFKVRFKNDYDAFGLLAGMNINWFFNNHWSIFGKAAASGLHGEFDVTTHLRQTAGSRGYIQTKDEMHRIRYGLEAALGLQWETCFCKNRHRFSVSLGYEFLQWFHQNQLKQFAATQSYGILGDYTQRHGNLGLQGGTLAARFDF